MDKEQVVELLKEVGEPVAWMHPEEGLSYENHYVGNIPLYTSDQLAAALLKATKPLEEEVERLNQQSANRLIGLCKCGEDNDELRAQLSAAQEEIVFASKDSLRLLETVKYLRGIAERGEVREQREDETVEQFVLGYVKKLEDQLAKAEQRAAEWQPIETAPKDQPVIVARIEGDHIFWVTDAKKSRIGFWSTLNGRAVNSPTHWCKWRKFVKEV